MDPLPTQLPLVIKATFQICQYGWYEWCYFRDQTTAFPNNNKVLGRVLGPARGAGNEMAQWILKHC